MVIITIIDKIVKNTLVGINQTIKPLVKNIKIIRFKLTYLFKTFFKSNYHNTTII